MKKITGHEILAVVMICVMLGVLYFAMSGSGGRSNASAALPASSADGTSPTASTPDLANAGPSASASPSSAASSTDTGLYSVIAPADSTVAPDFTLKTLDGQTITLSEAIKRGPVVVDFWATYCGPCKYELSELDRLKGRFQAEGVQILAVNVDANADTLHHFFSSAQLSYPILLDEPALSANQAYNISALPSTFVIDQHQRIRSVLVGFDPKISKDLPACLDVLLKEH